MRERRRNLELLQQRKSLLIEIRRTVIKGYRHRAIGKIVRVEPLNRGNLDFADIVQLV